MKSLFPAICILLTLASATLAQEFSRDLREIDEQLHEAKREQLFLQQNLRRIEAITKLFS